MADAPTQSSYSDAELERYFRDPDARRGATPGDGAPPPRRPATGGPGGDGAGGLPPHDGDDDEVKRRVNLAFLVVAGVVAAGILVVLTMFAVLAGQIPPLDAIQNPENREATLVYSADGQELARYYQNENRTWAALSEISPWAPQVLIATEDRRFYEHWGVDSKSILSAVKDAFLGDPRGASTISQQLARNLFRESGRGGIGNDNSVTRKLKEMITAVLIERNFTKDEILEMYLNTVAFSNNAYGIEAASKTYFNKTAAELDLPEAAVLIGMLKANTAYNPVRNPERSKRRRNVVIGQMERYGGLPADEAAAAKASDLVTDFQPYSHTDNAAPHFAEILRGWLKEWGEDAGYDVYKDGLRVHTTLDYRIQAIAEEAVREEGAKLQAVADYEWSRRSGYSLGTSTNAEDLYAAKMGSGDVNAFGYFWESQRRLVNRFIKESEGYRVLVREEGVAPEAALAQLRADDGFMEQLKKEKTRLEAGMVVIDPQTGFVRAWVGGRDYVEDKFDHVQLAQRQPGSTFKPFAYVAAIDNGYSPYYLMLDSAFTWKRAGYPDWSPVNMGGGSGEYITLKEALKNSNNYVTARLTYEVGPAQVANYARTLGVESPLEAVPSIALGVADVNLLEMTAAYSTIASGGTYHRPQFVTRIEDRNGNVVAEFIPESRQALSAVSAYTLTDMMRGVVDGGTGSRMRWKYGLREHDLAGKTGTTQGSADGWFIMMHPEMVVGAWAGFNDRRVAFRSSWWGQGAHNALHVVGNFSKALAAADDPAVRLDPAIRFQPPDEYVAPAEAAIFEELSGWHDETQVSELSPEYQQRESFLCQRERLLRQQQGQPPLMTGVCRGIPLPPGGNGSNGWNGDQPAPPAGQKKPGKIGW